MIFLVGPCVFLAPRPQMKDTIMARNVIIKPRSTRVGIYALVLAIVWTIVASLSLFWTLSQEKQKVLEIVRVMARSHFDKDVLYRRWNALHGGVYVPVSKKTPSNPHLSSSVVSERDIKTPSDRLLTLINPAYMTRQVHELGKLEYGIKGHITSLKPIRPANAADQWETEALKAFERGEAEVSQVLDFEGEAHMRFMRPLITEEGCLKCHAAQGYRVGDVRGGISVSIPMTFLWAVKQQHLNAIWMGLIALWLMGLAGIGVAFIGLNSRINERERVQHALKNSEQRQGQIVNFLPDATWVIDNDGKVVTWNRAIEELTGIKAEDMLGKGNYEYALPFYGKRRPVLIDLIREWDETYEERYISVEKVGEIFVAESFNPALGDGGTYLSAAARLLYDASGKAAGAIESLRDITDRKQMEKELIQAREAAEAANTAKSHFFANMSHEIRTPMNAIIGFTDILLDGDMDENQVDYLNTIKRSGEVLIHLINDILDLSKIEAGDLEFEEIEFDPELTIYDVCALIRPRIGEKPIELLCHIGNDVPAHVKGDPTRFRQVLTNLMGNASKFTESGEIEISVDLEEEKDNRVKLHTVIRDTGIGIPEDKVSSIFLAFQQADGSITRKYGGTGLGLSICKQISSLMDGDVWAESKEGKGSIFHFTAWLGKCEDRAFERYAPASLSGKKALIIDDNNTNLEILRRHLELVGMRVVPLTGGGETLQTLREALKKEDPFDVCISDIQMPDMSGYDVAQQIRGAKDQVSDIRLIALSSLMKGDSKKCEKMGFDGFLAKPIRGERLYQMLERILAEKGDAVKKDKAEPPKIMTQHSVLEQIKHSVRILLAEDNPVNQKLAKIMLTKAGYQVEVATNGKEALEKFTASPDDFDMIFMDVQMPEMDGLEATRAIRERGFDTIPIAAMTAHAIEGDREMCLEAGMDDYISKPIKREVVFQVLQKWVLDKKT